MGKIFIFMIIFILVVGIGLVYFFKDSLFDFSKTNDIELKKYYVEALKNGNKEEINLEVLYNNEIYSKIITNKKGLEEISAPITNSSIFINNPDCYSDIIPLSNNKISINCIQPGELNMIYDSNLSYDDGNIVLNISSSNVNRFLGLCFEWSINIIDVKLPFYNENYKIKGKNTCEKYNYVWLENNDSCIINEIDELPPTYYKNRIDRCYYLEKDIYKEEPLQLRLQYSSYPSLGSTDFIKISVFDGDLTKNGIYVFEKQGLDVGGENKVLLIK